MADVVVRYRVIRGVVCAGAAVAAVAFGAAEASADKGTKPKPRIFVQYSYFSDTVPPGQTRTVKASCPNGYSLLNSSIAPTSTGAGPTGLETPLFVDGILPGTDGVRVPFTNAGSLAADGEVGVGCIKAKDAEIKADIVRDRVTFPAAGGGTASQVCKERGAIPGEAGFTAAGARLAGGEYFESRGDIGFRMSFAGAPGGQGQLRLVCLRGTGVKLIGNFVGDRLSQTGPAEEKKGKPARIAIDYGSESVALRPDLSNAGGGVFVGEGAGTSWSNPYPAPPIAGPPPFDQAPILTGRGFIDLGEFNRGLPDPGSYNAMTVFFAMGFIPDDALDDIHVSSFAVISLRSLPIASRWDVYDEDDFANDPGTDPGGNGGGGGGPGGGGGGGGGGTGTGSKTVRPFESEASAPPCNPGFFVDVYIDADAQNPIHTFLENGGKPPCVDAPPPTVEVFPAGTQPPGNTDPLEGWRDHQSYRLSISSPTSVPASPKDFGVKIDWTDPSP